ncbi:MAG TPA: DUF1800 domain-containing protein [Dehalococcoidia bacterium]|nr:DUF1800 domain-containing protein [Dehalococcoidia bacterium]HIM49700.1 DUF1800 domain-containing protein [Dehalococcoidia bacterium]
MADKEIALMAHLMRRAGFGATFEELEARAAKGYEATVDELLDPEGQPELERDLMMRYQPQWVSQAGLEGQQEEWTYRMINTKRPLEEKIALFWHQIFVTGHAKCEYPKQQQIEFDMFRRDGLGKFDNLLQGLAKDPAMVFYLDNCMSHKDAINENWGRELLELFSMGVGMDGQVNYTEEDVKECARAFTGWTVTNSIPRYPYGKYEAKFIYDSGDHDNEEKTFLGETGNWNGEDIINIVARQPGTARFISRHLYNFFVADEPQVPAWQNTPPGDPEAIKALEDEYFRSGYDIRSMLRVLFNSDAFKNARFAKVKSPTETVVGTMRLVGDFNLPKPGMNAMALNIRYMGQDLMNPPTVEGWHTGREWIDSGTLVERINFTADAVGNTSHPGIQAIIQRLASQGPTISPEQLVDGCLDMLGAYELTEVTRNELLAMSQGEGDIRTGTQEFESRVGQMLQSIVATTEYLFA